nr:DUF4129 domain-containing protein [cf. Phormidesmis sp. LEGE 11477]
MWRRGSEWLEYQFAQADIDLPEFPDWSLPEEVGRVLFWLFVVALSVWLGWLLYRALEPSIQKWLAQDRQWVKLGQSAIAPEADHSAQYWWQQAQTFAQNGHYGEACKALYQATLQQLDDSRTLTHDPSRTDGEYLASLDQALGKPMPRPYQLLIGTHERLTFGAATATAEMFKRCRRAYEQIQKEIAKK